MVKQTFICFLSLPYRNDDCTLRQIMIIKYIQKVNKSEVDVEVALTLDVFFSPQLGHNSNFKFHMI